MLTTLSTPVDADCFSCSPAPLATWSLASRKRGALPGEASAGGGALPCPLERASGGLEGAAHAASRSDRARRREPCKARQRAGIPVPPNRRKAPDSTVSAAALRWLLLSPRHSTKPPHVEETHQPLLQ